MAEAKTPDGRQHQVAAISYDDQKDNAPRMVAKGKGIIADRILELAQENNIAIRQDPTLMAVLDALEVGQEMPPELYGVIAEVLAWAYAADNRAGEVRTARTMNPLRKAA